MFHFVDNSIVKILLSMLPFSPVPYAYFKAKILDLLKFEKAIKPYGLIVKSNDIILLNHTIYSFSALSLSLSTYIVMIRLRILDLIKDKKLLNHAI